MGEQERQTPVIVGTGRSFMSCFSRQSASRQLSPHSYLWAVVDGRRFEVKQDGMPISLNGIWHCHPIVFLVTTLPVPRFLCHGKRCIRRLS